MHLCHSTIRVLSRILSLGGGGSYIKRCLGTSGECPPRKVWDFWSSKIEIQEVKSCLELHFITGCVGAKNTAQSILKDVGWCCKEVIIKNAVDAQDVL